MRIGTLVCLLAAAVTGCGSCAEEASAVRAAETPAPRPPAEEVALAEPAAHLPEPPAWGMEVARPREDATRVQVLRGRVREGMRVHRAGDYEASRATFAAVVEDAPDYAAARFDLACALSRLGRDEEAAEHLRGLLGSDLASYLGRLERDEDLVGLRASPAMEAVRAHVAAASAAWERAIREGLLATLGTRVGFYVRAQERFYPVISSELEPGDFAVDLAHRRVGFAFVPWIEEEIEADAAYVLTQMAVETFAPPAPVITRHRHHEGLLPDELYRLVDATRDAVAFRGFGRFERSRFVAGDAPAPLPYPHEVAPEGYSLRGNALVIPEGEAIRLSAGHGAARAHSYAITDDGSVLLVASVRETGSEPEAFETYATRYATVFDRVDLRTREVTSLGTAVARGFVLAHRGDAYAVGLPDGARRYASFAAEHSLLPERLTPVPPAQR